MSKLNIKIFAVVFPLVVVLDQLSKQMVLNKIAPGEIVPIISGLFNLTLTFNRGMAFGLFSNLDPFYRTLVLSTAILFALIMVFFFLVKEYKDDPIANVALALIVGGAVGNVIDRFRFGSVVDFLDFYILKYHWPAFNVADSCICIAVVFLLIKQVQGEQKSLDSA